MEVKKYKERPDVKIEAVYIEKINKEVEKAGINVSNTLQETLMDRLNVSR